MASFAIALLFFALEVGVYKTVEPRAAISPGVIASAWMLFQCADSPLYDPLRVHVLARIPDHLKNEQ